MPIRLSRFEMPHNVQIDESTKTPTYTRFTAEPFEIGYARTIGNSLRRVLLSSIEGAAIASVKFKVIPGKNGEDGFEREVRLHDKVKALELMGKHLGMFTDKFDLTGNVPVIISGADQLED